MSEELDLNHIEALRKACPEGDLEQLGDYVREADGHEDDMWADALGINERAELIAGAINSLQPLVDRVRELQGDNLAQWTGTLCPECGPNVLVDEDGCCNGCGACATGRGVEAVIRIIEERDQLRDRVTEPSWFLELTHLLQTQDNRITADPLFCVQQERRVWGMDSSYSDEFEWALKDDPEGTIHDEDIAEHIREHDEDNALANLDDDEIDPEDHGYEKVFYTRYWDFVTAHFTEEAADRYLRQNAHNLNNPRVYVTSQYRCDEWNRVRSFLLDSTPRARSGAGASPTKETP